MKKLKKILVVEDEDRMRKLIKDYLTRAGYAVVEADDGLVALEIFKKEDMLGIYFIFFNNLLFRPNGFPIITDNLL